MKSDLATLRELWELWAASGAQLTEEEWSASTRCDRWDVKTLYAHHSCAVTRLEEFSERPTDLPPDHHTAASFLGQFRERPDDPMLVDEAATAVAKATSTDELVAVFAERGPLAIERARRAGDVVVQTDEGRIRLGEYIRTRIVESVVHLLDLGKALGKPPDVPGEALRTTAHVMVEFAPLPEFIEVSTGRSDARLFPVFW